VLGSFKKRNRQNVDDLPEQMTKKREKLTHGTCSSYGRTPNTESDELGILSINKDIGRSIMDCFS
jgi:hypothetical protein